VGGFGDNLRGCRDFNLLESAVSRPFQTVFGGDAYPTIFDKGAALFHSLVANHPFHDGNKRTAVTALYAFLLGPKYRIECEIGLFHFLLSAPTPLSVEHTKLLKNCVWLFARAD
jgi:death-on-curing family protein